MVDASKLVDAVNRVSPGVDSVIALLNNLKQQIIDDLAGDAAAQAIVDEAFTDLSGDADKIDAALKSNPNPSARKP